MLRRTRTLHPLNGQLRIAGETYFTHQVALDLEERILFLQHPHLGELKIHETDHLQMDFLDLEVPTCIRALQRREGWEALTLTQLIDLITATHHAQEG